MCVSFCQSFRCRSAEMMSSAATALCHFAQAGRREATGAEGHVRVGVRLALIASCDKWRGQCGEIITAHTVSVNRCGTRTTAPRMNTFKQGGVFIALLFPMWHYTFGPLLCTLDEQWMQSKNISVIQHQLWLQSKTDNFSNFLRASLHKGMIITPYVWPYLD